MQFIFRLSLVSIALAGSALLAQENPISPDVVDETTSTSDSLSTSNNFAAPSTTTTPGYTPLTLKQKYLYSVNQTFTLPKFAILSIRAGLDHYNRKPTQWGVGADGYSIRFASLLGRSLVREQIAFGIRAIDHEDPRYFRLGQGTVVQRTKYAMIRTFIVRKDNGDFMPAYSRFIASYGMPFIARQWRPGPIHTLPDGLQAGSVGVGLGMVTNICQEFLPDLKLLKNRLHH